MGGLTGDWYKNISMPSFEEDDVTSTMQGLIETYEKEEKQFYSLFEKEGKEGFVGFLKKISKVYEAFNVAFTKAGSNSYLDRAEQKLIAYNNQIQAGMIGGALTGPSSEEVRQLYEDTLLQYLTSAELGDQIKEDLRGRGISLDANGGMIETSTFIESFGNIINASITGTNNNVGKAIRSSLSQTVGKRPNVKQMVSYTTKKDSNEQWHIQFQVPYEVDEAKRSKNLAALSSKSRNPITSNLLYGDNIFNKIRQDFGLGNDDIFSQFQNQSNLKGSDTAIPPLAIKLTIQDLISEAADLPILQNYLRKIESGIIASQGTIGNFRGALGEALGNAIIAQALADAGQSGIEVNPVGTEYEINDRKRMWEALLNQTKFFVGGELPVDIQLKLLNNPDTLETSVGEALLTAFGFQVKQYRSQGGIITEEKSQSAPSFVSARLQLEGSLSTALLTLFGISEVASFNGINVDEDINAKITKAVFPYTLRLIGYDKLIAKAGFEGLHNTFFIVNGRFIPGSVMLQCLLDEVRTATVSGGSIGKNIQVEVEADPQPVSSYDLPDGDNIWHIANSKNLSKHQIGLIYLANYVNANWNAKVNMSAVFARAVGDAAQAEQYWNTGRFNEK